MITEQSMGNYHPFAQCLFTRKTTLWVFTW